MSNGSLILSQIFEDKNTVDTGLPLPVRPAAGRAARASSGRLGV